MQHVLEQDRLSIFQIRNASERKFYEKTPLGHTVHWDTNRACARSHHQHTYAEFTLNYPLKYDADILSTSDTKLAAVHI